jgi:hypothetical protein
VARGADPSTIKLRFDGAQAITLDEAGNLLLRTAGGEMIQRRPVVYQEAGKTRREVACRYVLIEDKESSRTSRDARTENRSKVVGLEVGAYDAARPLIIDPVLVYSTYLGGGGGEEGTSIAVDQAGNAYVTGFTDSLDFHGPGSAQANLAGREDAFVVKLDPSGDRILYSTYIGGEGQDNGSSIVVDSAGNAYVTGFTDSAAFPALDGVQPAAGGAVDGFIAKLNPSGGLVYSTHLGGSSVEYGSGIALDPAGNLCVSGVSASPDFPVVNAIQGELNGECDLYVAKLNAAGTQLIYSTYLGGSGDDLATSIAADGSGNLYVTGITASADFPTANPLQATHRGGLFDAFVMKLDPEGRRLVYSTYLGGDRLDEAFRIAVDSAGNACVTGDTDSMNFPTASALQPFNGGGTDVFIAKLNASGARLIYSTYLGGSGADGGTAIAFGAGGTAHITGFTGSADFPTFDPVQRSFGGGALDAFVVALSPSGASLDYSTYLGGGATDSGFGIAVDTLGIVHVMGITASGDFPVTAGQQQANGGGASDIFVARIGAASAAGPDIIGAEVAGKKLFVNGSGFRDGAKILVNGEQQKTRNDEQSPAAVLIAKKAGKTIRPGTSVTLQVRNPDGALSNPFTFTRP